MKNLVFLLFVFFLSVVTAHADTKKVVVISDTHMGDSRSIDPDNAWGWFNKNRPKLIAFLEYIADRPAEYSTLVVAGDMFDEWVAPMDVTPFINLEGEETRNESDFFQVLVRDNQAVLDAFRKVRAAGIELIYVPGNHDMTCTEEDFDKYLPGLFTQARDAAGLGSYTPEGMEEVVIEHGHRYDFNDMPNPISMPGSLLPIGYTISKYASTLGYNARQREKNNDHSSLDADYWENLEEVLADEATEAAFNAKMQTLKPEDRISYEDFCKVMRKIKEDGVLFDALEKGELDDSSFDDQFNKFVYNAAWAAVMIVKRPASIGELIEIMLTDVIFPSPYEYSYMYWNILPWLKEKPVIYDGLWPQATWERHQEINNVPVKMSYLSAVLSGGVDIVLDSFAPYQYFENPESNKRIVVFGHTHKPLMNVFDDVKDKGKCIYANTGTWIDEAEKLTYVELQKTDKQYSVVLRQWGKEEALEADTIDLKSDPTKIENTITDSSRKNAKFVDRGNVLILHNNKTYTISGTEK